MEQIELTSQQLLANQVAADTDAASAGVRITVDIRHHEPHYIISAGKGWDYTAHHLLCDVTSRERLTAHTLGFIENVKEASQ